MAIYQCTECGYRYDEAVGDKHEGLRPGTRWLSLPADFACPSCAVRSRDDFVALDDPAPTAPGA